MGTSQDYEVAVQEGATIVRLGSVLYEARSRRARGSRAIAPRQPRALPGERRLALVLHHQLGVGAACAGVLLGHAERVQGRPRRGEPTTSIGTSRSLERLEALPGDRARHLAQRLGHRLRDARGAPCRWRVASRAISRQRSGSARAARPPRRHPPRRARARRPGAPSLAVHVAGARVARVGGRDLDQRRHALRVLEREGHRGGGAHRAAHQRGPLDRRGRPAPPRGRPPGRRTRRPGAGGGGAVSAGVVGDQAVAALDQLRASPAPRCAGWREAVQRARPADPRRPARRSRAIAAGAGNRLAAPGIECGSHGPTL